VTVNRRGETDAVATAASRSRLYSVFKRLMDVTVGCAILVLVIPVIPAIALMIKLDSPGPVFFKQERIGRFGRPFQFYKFRSMHREAETRKRDIERLNEQKGPVFKMRSDPRVTHVGNFLRRSSLDEMPQILNVLKGDMSLVGPRPHMPAEVAAYEPWHRARLNVKPGITCLWQISGRSEISFDQWMHLDLEYIERRGALTDLAILFRTVPAVMARKGAY
jgi:exopolysaccharide biosynthesis polyprenyl glycosylphosphotransferase